MEGAWHHPGSYISPRLPSSSSADPLTRELQSLGWEHYEVHEPEPHILLFKWVTLQLRIPRRQRTDSDTDVPSTTSLQFTSDGLGAYPLLLALERPPVFDTYNHTELGIKGRALHWSKSAFSDSRLQRYRSEKQDCTASAAALDKKDTAITFFLKGLAQQITLSNAPLCGTIRSEYADTRTHTHSLCFSAFLRAITLAHSSLPVTISPLQSL